MKKFGIVLIGMVLLLSGCRKERPELNLQEVYEKKDALRVQFRQMKFTDKVYPMNQNDEYYFYEPTADNIQILDVQFCVENLSGNPLKMHDYIDGKLATGFLYADSYLYLENDDYMEVVENVSLAPKSKNVCHLTFHINDEEVKEIVENQKKIELMLFDEEYVLPVKEITADAKELKRNDVIETDNMKIKILSASASRYIPPLNLEKMKSSYSMKDKDKQYAGMYIHVENKSDKAIDTLKEIPTYVGIAGKDKTNAWISVLNKDSSDFVDSYVIKPHESRDVLIFQEVPLDYEDTKYHFSLIFDGKVYRHSFVHKVFREKKK